MRSSLSKVIFILFASVCFWGCIDEISFPQINENEGNLVIQGKLIKGNPSIISVNISRIGTLSDTINTEFVPVKLVNLVNNMGQELSLTQASIGNYRAEIPASSSFSVATDQRYQLHILSLNDEMIQSSFEPLHDVTPIDSISFEMKERVVLDRLGEPATYTYLDYQVSTSLEISGEYKSYLKWTFEGCSKYIELQPPEVIPPFPPPDTCYIKEKLNINKVVLFNGEDVGGNYLARHSVLEETLNSRYTFGYYLTVFQESLSLGAHNYWNQVSQVTQRNGGLFETPAGEIESNFSNLDNPDQIIYGYFYAVAQDTFRQYIYPKDVDYPLHSCGEFSGDGYFDAPRRCRDCLLWKNSSFERPEYWEE